METEFNYKSYISIYKMDGQKEKISIGNILLTIPKIKMDYSTIPITMDKDFIYSSVSEEKDDLNFFKKKKNCLLRKNFKRNSKAMDIAFHANSFNEAELIGATLCKKYIGLLPLRLFFKLNKRFNQMFGGNPKDVYEHYFG